MNEVRVERTNRSGQLNGLLTECHVQDSSGRVLHPRDYNFELKCSLVSLAHRALQRRHMHSPIAKGIPFGSNLFLGHIERMDRDKFDPQF